MKLRTKIQMQNLSKRLISYDIKAKNYNNIINSKIAVLSKTATKLPTEPTQVKKGSLFYQNSILK